MSMSKNKFTKFHYNPPMVQQEQYRSISPKSIETIKTYTEDGKVNTEGFEEPNMYYNTGKNPSPPNRKIKGSRKRKHHT